MARLHFVCILLPAFCLRARACGSCAAVEEENRRRGAKKRGNKDVKSGSERKKLPEGKKVNENNNPNIAAS